jgi:hypothetical protein
LMPVQYFGPKSAWSVSLNRRKYLPPPKKDSAVSVQEVNAEGKAVGQPLKLNYMKVNTEPFGMPLCVIFRPDNLTVAAGKRYRVELADLQQRDGQAAPPLSFVVEFVSLK